VVLKTSGTAWRKKRQRLPSKKKNTQKNPKMNPAVREKGGMNSQAGNRNEARPQDMQWKKIDCQVRKEKLSK